MFHQICTRKGNAWMLTMLWIYFANFQPGSLFSHLVSSVVFHWIVVKRKARKKTKISVWVRWKLSNHDKVGDFYNLRSILRREKSAGDLTLKFGTVRGVRRRLKILDCWIIKKFKLYWRRFEQSHWMGMKMLDSWFSFTNWRIKPPHKGFSVCPCVAHARRTPKGDGGVAHNGTWKTTYSNIFPAPPLRVKNGSKKFKMRFSIKK